MKKVRIIPIIICSLLAACINQDQYCNNDFEDDWMDAESVKMKLWENYRDDSVEFPSENDETYRLRWSNGWVSTIYVTFSNKGNQCYLYLDGFSMTKKEYLRQEYGLNRKEWENILAEIDRIGFWCSKYYSGFKGFSITDGTDYLLEGMKKDKFHVTMWQIDEVKEPLLDQVLEVVKSRLRNDQYRTIVEGDSIVFDFSINPQVAEAIILTENDTISIDNFRRLRKKIAKKDSMEIENWIVLQDYVNGLKNRIPLAKLELYFPKQDITEEEARKMVEEAKE